MSFRCTACSDKSYDKAWKLQRHIRESSKCSEQLNPGISRTRFICWSCGYTSPRKDDVRRHRRRIHPDIAITTVADTEEAGQPMVGSYETSDVVSCPQPMIPLDVNERSGEIERLDPHPTSDSPATGVKRKTSDPDDLSPEHKRACIGSLLPDLDTLSLVDNNDARETSPPKAAHNKDGLSLTTWQPTAGGLTALVVTTSSAKLQSTRSSNIGAPQSMSICGSSIGSLFGRPSTHAYEPWRTWSFTLPPSDSVRSLGSLGMPAPMLQSVDEELVLSRAGNDLGEYRRQDHRSGEVFVERWLTRSSKPGPAFKSGPVLWVKAYSCPEDPVSIPRSPPSIQSSMALTAQNVASLDPTSIVSLPSLSSESSSGSDSSLRSSAANAAMRPGPMNDEGHDVGSTKSDIQMNDAAN
jgi:hypothetical protein